MSTPDNTTGSGLIYSTFGAIAVIVALWIAGVIQPFGPDKDDDVEPDVVVIGDIEERAVESDLDAAAGQAENLREIADKLDDGDFKSVKDGVSALKKLNTDARSKAWKQFADAMIAADKQNNPKSAAKYMRKTADGLDHLVETRGK